MIDATTQLQSSAMLDSRAAQQSAAGQRLLKGTSGQPTAGVPAAGSPAAGESQLREKFNSFVGESFYGQMLQAMHKTVGKAAYFNGGRAEEMFQGQLDQVLSEKMTQASGNSLTNSMFDLFNLQLTGGRR
jgi:hypothetical protein